MQAWRSSSTAAVVGTPLDQVPDLELGERDWLCTQLLFRWKSLPLYLCCNNQTLPPESWLNDLLSLERAQFWSTLLLNLCCQLYRWQESDFTHWGKLGIPQLQVQPKSRWGDLGILGRDHSSLLKYCTTRVIEPLLLFNHRSCSESVYSDPMYEG